MAALEKPRQDFDVSFQRWSPGSKKYEADAKRPKAGGLTRGEKIIFANLEIELSVSGRQILLRKTKDKGGAIITEKFQGLPTRTLEVGKNILPNALEQERRAELVRDSLGPDELAKIHPENPKFSGSDTFTFSIKQGVGDVLGTKTEWSADKTPKLNSSLQSLKFYERKPKDSDDHPDRLVITNLEPGIGERGDMLL